MYNFDTLTRVLFALVISWPSLSAVASVISIRAEVPATKFAESGLNMDVRIDTSKETGTVFPASGEDPIGVFQFFPYTTMELFDQSILKIDLESLPGSTWLGGYSFYFLASPDRDSFRFIMLAGFIIDNGVDTDSSHWQVMGRFLNEPYSMSEEDLVELGVFLSLSLWVKDDKAANDFACSATFMHKYLELVLSDLSARTESAEEEDALEVNFRPGFMFDFDRILLSSVKLEIHQMVQKIWSPLSLTTKAYLLENLSSGGSESAQIYCDLLKSFLNEVGSRYQTSPYSRTHLIKTILRTSDSAPYGPLQFVLRSPNVSKVDKAVLLEKIFYEFLNNEYFISYPGTGFIKKAILPMDGIFWKPGVYRDLISEYLTKIAYSNSRNLSLPSIVCSMHQYIDESYFSSIEFEDVWRSITTIDDGIDRFSFLDLINLMDAPLSVERRAILGELILSSPWSEDLSLIVAKTKKFPFSGAELMQFYYKAIDHALALLDNRTRIGDTFGDRAEWFCEELAYLLKQSDEFPELAPLFEPILIKLNPRAAEETDETYGRRLEKILNLWTESQILLMDLSGGFVHGPLALDSSPVDYVDIIANISRVYPGMVDIVALSTSESGEANSGVIQFNWTLSRYSTPFLVGKVLLHEGAHAADLQPGILENELNLMFEYWYYEENARGESMFEYAPTEAREIMSDPYENFVSHYAGSNPSEHIAESFRYWHMGSDLWWDYALDMFEIGHPSLLNLFLLINESVKPVVEGTYLGDDLISYQIDESTGFVNATSIPAVWLFGDIRGGVYQISFPEKTLYFLFNNFVIVAVSEEGMIGGEAEVFEVKEHSEFTYYPDLLDVSSAGDGLPVLYSLANGLEEIKIDPETGAVTWTPLEEQGPGEFTFLVSAVQGDKLHSQVLQVNVTEENSAPYIDKLPDLGVDEGELLEFEVPGTDTDIPANELVYTLIDPPPGMDIDEKTGLISWKPDRTQGSAEYLTTIRLSDGIEYFDCAVNIEVKDVRIGGYAEEWLIGKLKGWGSEATLLSADPDRDGLPNLLEYVSGSSPALWNSNAYMLSIGNGDLFRVHLRADDPALSYILQVSHDLHNWSPVRIEFTTDSWSLDATELVTFAGQQLVEDNVWELSIAPVETSSQIYLQVKVLYEP